MPGTTDTVKAMLTPGEFVIRKEAVDMIGVPILEKLNDMPEAGGHSEIDRLIAQATLKNMTGMYGGGKVMAYKHGGKVDMYGHGGKVKNQMMMGYEHGGEAHGNLKPIPKDNPGLAKLPEAVRNKMGYMQDGGSVNSMYNLNELKKLMPMKASNLMGTFDEDQAEVVRKIISGLDISDKERSMLTPKMEKPMGIPTEVQSELLRRIISGDSLSTEEQQNFTPRMSPLGMEDGGLLGMMKGGMAKKKKKYGYQEGGAVQDDAMMLEYLQSLQAQQANPFVPFDQRPPSSGEMMSPIPSGMEQGDMMRIIRDEREVLDMEDAELLRQKGKNFFEKLRLDSLQSKILDSLMQLDSGRIERLPADTSGFIPSSPMFRNRGMGL